MTGQFLERIPVAALSLEQQLLGDGGQGRIYRVTAIHGRPPTLELVCKKYKPQWLELIDAEGLINLVRFQGKLYGAPRELLSERTAWPQAVVEDASGRPIGFLMPAIPEDFLRPLHLPGCGNDEYCQLQHLLNDEAYLSLVRIPLKNSWRIEFLRDVAETIGMLHRHGVTVGDLSPLNIFPSFTSIPRCFFVDCDAMKLNGRSVLPQAETRGWQAPAGQQTGTIHSDAYKFALLAIRLFAGDQDTRDPAALFNFSRQLGELARQGIGTNPWSRPSPQQWAHALRLPAGNTSPTPIRPAPNRPPSHTPTPTPVQGQSLPQRFSLPPTRFPDRQRGWRRLRPALSGLPTVLTTALLLAIATAPPTAVPAGPWNCPARSFCVWSEPDGMGKHCEWEGRADWQTTCPWALTTEVKSYQNNGTDVSSNVNVYVYRNDTSRFACVPRGTAWNVTAKGVLLRSHVWTADKCPEETGLENVAMPPSFKQLGCRCKNLRRT